jgi:hypothetical protein
MRATICVNDDGQVEIRHTDDTIIALCPCSLSELLAASVLGRRLVRGDLDRTTTVLEYAMWYSDTIATREEFADRTVVSRFVATNQTE